MYARRSQYDTRMRDMKEFFAFAQIDKNLQRRLIDYFNATWSKRKGMQQVDSTLQTFPSNLRGEIFQHLHSQFLNLPVFQYTSPSCRNFIALRVQRMFFTPDEFLVYEGDRFQTKLIDSFQLFLKFVTHLSCHFRFDGSLQRRANNRDLWKGRFIRIRSKGKGFICQ